LRTPIRAGVRLGFWTDRRLMRLSHRDFDGLQGAILELHEFRDLEGFKRTVPGIFLKVLPADYFLLNEYMVDLAVNSAAVGDYVESDERFDEELIDHMADRVIEEHPFTKYLASGQAITALKLSDFLTLTQLDALGFFQEMFRSLHINRLLGVPVSPGQKGRAAAVSVMKRGRDFGERDRLILNLLRPHFNQAQRNAKLVSALLAKQPRGPVEYGLTPRETEVARWMALGKTNPEIGIILQNSRRTIDKHMEKILGKLGVENRTAAALMMAEASQAYGPR
jgi:DNA-binding CsgD family transcriptional regulator